MPNLTREQFVELAERLRGGSFKPGVKRVAIRLVERLLSDQLTPVLAYRRLVAPDERTATSFLLESVEGGDRVGRHSILGAQPMLEVIATGNEVRILDDRTGREEVRTVQNPLAVVRELTCDLIPAPFDAAWDPEGCPLGGWVGYAGYDTVRYAEPEKLNSPPRDDRGLPDLHFGLYDNTVIFDHVDKLVYVIQLAIIDVGEGGDGTRRDACATGEVYDDALSRIEARVREIQQHGKPLTAGTVGQPGPVVPMASNITREDHARMVSRAQEYIGAGDIFQVVIGQRFERTSEVDPFDVYRALRAVNPSPYMVYLQAAGCILVASSPEILCRVRRAGDASVVTNRPLAGTRKRGATPEEDAALAAELLADEKERAEHIMLVDLGRNDVGKVAKPGSIKLPAVMEIERYSHVMHISSTVTGELRDDLDCWDALAAALPVGTISGAPKIRAMQIIDELEPVRRGPYGGGMGYVALDGQMDIALALRTIVVPTEKVDGRWTYHIQAAGGIVADSKAEAEYMETVNKAAALGRAIDLAEGAFL